MTWRRSPGDDPQPGDPVDLIGDGEETRVRQVLSSDDRLGIHEIRDDRGVVVFITAGKTIGTWVQVLEV